MLGDLADRFGTPLYVMDIATIRHKLSEWSSALGEAGRVFYAGKAFLCRAMVELVHQCGMGLDVVSGGELYTALLAGMPAANIIFHGNVKTESELRLALDNGVGQIVVDSLDELSRLQRLAMQLAKPARVFLRLTPGIEAHTHEFIRTGHFDTKFGFPWLDGVAHAAVDRALTLSGLHLVGFHAHIGSQILDSAPFLANAEALMKFSREQYARHGFWPEELDLGGGLGVTYEPEEEALRPADVVRAVKMAVATLTPNGLPIPRLSWEPGRSIVADAGVTLYRVSAKKKIPGGRTYVAVDGGMGDNIRPALYQARYRAAVVGSPRATREVVTLAGRYCESGDILVHDAEMPVLETGDLVTVLTTGAYNFSMASTYNRVPRPAVVAVENGAATVWVEAETWADLSARDRPLADRAPIPQAGF